MRTGWIRSACGIRVDHLPCPHPLSSVDTTRAPAGVMHTVEGSFDSGMAVFRQHYAPHFLVGPHRIAQLVPVGAMAAALEHTADPPTNGWARVQIEVAGHSQTHPYRFDPATEEALAHLLAALHLLEIVPLSRPFVDLMPPPPWATPTFLRRHAGKWGSVAGWYGHVEIPENSHWDPGALAWAPLLQRAKTIAAGHSKPHRPPRRLPRARAIPALVRRRVGNRNALPI